MEVMAGEIEENNLWKKTPDQDFNFQESLIGSSDVPKHVLIVMDALKEFSIEPLEWALKNVALKSCCSVTILGMMPWLNIPLSAKTSSDIWSVDFQELSIIREKRDKWRSEYAKYHKVQYLIDLCEKYGVEPKIRTEMGHPLKLLVVDLITRLQATLVVFDRHHDKKNIEYYAEKVPYDMVVINEDGEMDMIKGRSQKIKKAEESPASMVPSATKPMISGQIIKFFKPKCVKT
ncbi:hypothetical protein K7X08_012636 [Anisodus acutangulus]|uniref:Uncharacterized protein n=1 Tax=Anisodus acutangulus TaxID=402998 RepID=A0A9Q1RG55_9SOLA|nr:hypothetical protein K7X08_012636 [Anisodus acutangulus]